MNKTEWGSCIVVGSTVLIWNAILKLLPEKWFSKLNTSKLINEDEESKSIVVKKLAEQRQKESSEPVEAVPEEQRGDDDDHYQEA
jgi:hypothetical protein